MYEKVTNVDIRNKEILFDKESGWNVQTHVGVYDYNNEKQYI